MAPRIHLDRTSDSAPSRPHPCRGVAKAAAVALAVVFTIGAESWPPGRVPVVHGQATGSGPAIVSVDPRFDPAVVARDLGLRPTHVYRFAINGFAADLSETNVSAAGRDARVVGLAPDLPVRTAGPMLPLPTGVNRIDADAYPPAGIAGDGGEIDVDVAVLDTGINRRHDLRVAGGKSCNSEHWRDASGHGTLVAGIIAAKDDGQDVVGVAPGARLWAVKVIGRRGEGRLGDVICGIEWVLRHNRHRPGQAIEVVNMSLQIEGQERDCAPIAAISRAIRCTTPSVTWTGEGLSSSRRRATATITIREPTPPRSCRPPTTK